MEKPNLTGTALHALVSEALFGAPQGAPCWFLNPGDPGLVTLLRDVSAAEASTPPGPDRKTIVAHASHILYHLQLIERVLAGEKDPFSQADWEAAWQITTLGDEAWRELVDQMNVLGAKWLAACEHVDTSDEIQLTGSLGSPCHFAYHLSAVRQILLTVRAN